MRKTSEILTIISINGDKLIKAKEYTEKWYRDSLDKYPFNNKNAIKIASEWSLYYESEAYTYNGRIYVKLKHHTSDDSLVSWYKTKCRRYTAYNVAKACEAAFIE